jgi:hypothetical protein
LTSLPPRTLARLGLLLAAFTSAACQPKECSLVYTFSGATLKLHLPPQSDVAMPETVTACREPDCATATLPSVDTPEAGNGVVFSAFDVTASLFVTTGDVRILTILWPVTIKDINPRDPGNTYDVDVKDAKGVETGKLSGVVTYEHIVDTDCNVDLLLASLSD